MQGDLVERVALALRDQAVADKLILRPDMFPIAHFCDMARAVIPIIVEACAGVAEASPELAVRSPSQAHENGYREASMDIAAAIRAITQKEG